MNTYVHGSIWIRPEELLLGKSTGRKERKVYVEESCCWGLSFRSFSIFITEMIVYRFEFIFHFEFTQIQDHVVTYTRTSLNVQKVSY